MNIEKEIKDIKERNKRVEKDKKWETSWTRRICIMILTYLVVIIYSYILKKYDYQMLLTDFLIFFCQIIRFLERLSVDIFFTQS